MDKETLSHYGWVIIIIIILIILLGLYNGLGDYLYQMTDNSVNSVQLLSSGTPPKSSGAHEFYIGRTKRENVIAVFNEDYSEVIIRKNGDVGENDGYMVDWTSLKTATAESTPFENPMWTHRDTITKITIEEGVSNIGDLCFTRCANAESNDFKLPSTLKYVGKQAFRGCEKLTGKLVFPAACEHIDEASFTLTGFTDVDFGYGMKTIGACAFFQHEHLEHINLRYVKEIQSYAFDGIPTLSGTLKIPDNCEFIGDWAFGSTASMPNLTALTLGNSVKYIGTSAFQYFNNVSNEIILPESLEYIGDFAFNHMYIVSNKTLYIPKNVKQIGGTSVNKPDPSDNYVYNNGYYEHTLENYKDCEYYDTGSWVFGDFGRSQFTSFIVDPQNQYFTAIDGILYNKDVTTLIFIPAIGHINYDMPEGVKTAYEAGMCYARKITLADSFVIHSWPDAPDTQLNYENTLECAMYVGSPQVDISVKNTNPRYISENGSIYTKDAACKLLHLYICNSDVYIKDGCTGSDGGTHMSVSHNKSCFNNKTIYFPDSFANITNYNSNTYQDTREFDCINAMIKANSSFHVVFNSTNPYLKTNTNGTIAYK